MKNRIYWCSCAFFTLVIVFTMAYYISFQSSLSHKEYQNSKKQESLEATDDAVSVDGHSSERILETTKYVVESYDVADAVYSDKKETLPNEYIGLTKSELEAKLKEYTKSISPEQENGLLYVTLEAFSQDSITVRKVYDNKAKYEYYITVKDGYIVVYENDKKTIAEETEIAYAGLEDSQKKELDQGVYIDSVDELYSTLESYSS